MSKKNYQTHQRFLKLTPWELMQRFLNDAAKSASSNSDENVGTELQTSLLKFYESPALKEGHYLKSILLEALHDKYPEETLDYCRKVAEKQSWPTPPTITPDIGDTLAVSLRGFVIHAQTYGRGYISDNFSSVEKPRNKSHRNKINEVFWRSVEPALNHAYESLCRQYLAAAVGKEAYGFFNTANRLLATKDAMSLTEQFGILYEQFKDGIPVIQHKIEAQKAEAQHNANVRNMTQNSRFNPLAIAVASQHYAIPDGIVVR